jgi:NAD(P)-dependent dehydrogenase (short-subunit alcohol dehydrogenase family)
MSRLAGKIAIVTGAASGIGAEIARAAAVQGAKVVVADINAEGAARHAAALRAQNLLADSIQTDIGDEASIKELIEFAIRNFGGLDILCNNAADTRMSSTRDGVVEQMSTDVWDATMRVNLRGTMLASKFAIPQLRARGGGAIVNISSGAALAGATGYTAYGVSKAAIITLTQYLATQHGKDGIRCNAIAPGLIVTPATEATYVSGPVGAMMLRHHLSPRLGRPADIASAVVFLASDEAEFINGHLLCVDGGLMAHQPYYADAFTPPSKG